MDFQLKGYSLPLTPEGTSSLVDSPPWYFGGDTIEVAFQTDVNLFRKFLPYPLELSHFPGLMAVSMVDMTSVSNVDAMYEQPERSQFRECLLKMHCVFNGHSAWYVPLSFVNNDFTLVRGFIQGFGKKLAPIHMSKLHNLNPMIGGKQSGTRIKAICEVFNGISIELTFEYQSPTEKDRFAGTSMFVMRHYPDIEVNLRPAVHELSEVIVRDARKVDIWEGKGSATIRLTASEEISQLQPIKIFSARTFSEGFELVGGRVLHRYQ